MIKTLGAEKKYLQTPLLKCIFTPLILTTIQESQDCPPHIFHCASKGHERTSYFPEITQLIVASIHREVDFKSVHFECGSLGESFLLDMGEKLTLVDFFSIECSQIIYLRLQGWEGGQGRSPFLRWWGGILYAIFGIFFCLSLKLHNFQC